jgi:hypothetical protein
MDFLISNSQGRLDLIAFLKEKSGNWDDRRHSLGPFSDSPRLNLCRSSGRRQGGRNHKKKHAQAGKRLRGEIGYS